MYSCGALASKKGLFAAFSACFHTRAASDRLPCCCASAPKEVRGRPLCLRLLPLLHLKRCGRPAAPAGLCCGLLASACLRALCRISALCSASLLSAPPLLHLKRCGRPAPPLLCLSPLSAYLFTAFAVYFVPSCAIAAPLLLFAGRAGGSYRLPPLPLFCPSAGLSAFVMP